MKPIHSLLVVLAFSSFATAHAQVRSKASPAQLAARNGRGPVDYRALGASTPIVQPSFAPAPLVGGSDSCVTPDVIVGTGTFAFDNTTATTGTEGQAEALCNLTGAGTTILSDVWFTWTATQSALAEVNTCGLTSVDTKIAIYDGTTCPTSGAAIACNDDACVGFQSTVSFPVVAGQSYLIQIGLYPGTAPVATPGAGNFSVNVLIPPTNDDCTTPIAITGSFSGPHAFNNALATTGTQGQSESLCVILGLAPIQNDIWYTWTAPVSGQYGVQTLGLTQVDTKIAVYDGSTCPTGPAIACNEDANEPNFVYLQSRAVFTAVAGQSYLIQLGTSPTSAGGDDGEFTIVPVGAPSNDDCATPIVVSGAGPHFFDNTQATTSAQGQTEALCNLFGTTSMIEDIWYTWTPTSSGPATLTTCGLTITDTRIAVYDGSGCPATPALDCNDDACGATGFQAEVNFNAVCGQTYTIQISVYPNYAAPTGGQGRFSVTVAGGTSCDTGTVYCAGDGVAPHAACPCGNNSPAASQVGCLNSFGVGGRLRASGVASLSGDTVVLTADNLPAASTLFFQGTLQTAGGNGTPFGDGLRCVGGSVVRLKTYPAVGAGGSAVTTYPQGLDPSVSVRGNIGAPGLRMYQAWYRNAAAFCTASTFNLTNGLQINWGS